jgi:hypothetical protein
VEAVQCARREERAKELEALIRKQQAAVERQASEQSVAVVAMHTVRGLSGSTAVYPGVRAGEGAAAAAGGGAGGGGGGGGGEGGGGGLPDDTAASRTAASDGSSSSTQAARAPRGHRKQVPMEKLRGAQEVECSSSVDGDGCARARSSGVGVLSWQRLEDVYQLRQALQNCLIHQPLSVLLEPEPEPEPAGLVPAPPAAVTPSHNSQLMAAIAAAEDDAMVHDVPTPAIAPITLPDREVTHPIIYLELRVPRSSSVMATRSGGGGGSSWAGQPDGERAISSPTAPPQSAAQAPSAVAAAAAAMVACHMSVTKHDAFHSLQAAAAETRFVVAHIADVRTAKELRRLGYCTEALTKVLAHLRQGGFDLAVLECQREKEGVYARSGFVKVNKGSGAPSVCRMCRLGGKMVCALSATGSAVVDATLYM